MSASGKHPARGVPALPGVSADASADASEDVPQSADVSPGTPPWRPLRFWFPVIPESHKDRIRVDARDLWNSRAIRVSLTDFPGRNLVSSVNVPSGDPVSNVTELPAGVAEEGARSRRGLGQWIEIAPRREPNFSEPLGASVDVIPDASDRRPGITATASTEQKEEASDAELVSWNWRCAVM